MELKHLKLDLTSNCNQKCTFCPYHGENVNEGSINKKNKLDLEIIKSNIFEELKFDSLQISGSGEGLMHPQFAKISGFIRQKVDNLRLITNGTLINKHINCLIENYDNILVSIHGYGDIHEDIVKLTGAFNKTINGLLILKEKYYEKVKIHYILTEKNLIDVKPMISFSKNFNIPIIFTLDFLPNIEQYSQKIQELISTINYIRESDYIINPDLSNNEIKKFFTNKNYIIDPYRCEHINQAIEIASNGDVNICRSGVFGNIYTEKLSSIISSYERIVFLEDIKKELLSNNGLSHPRCNRCCYQKVPSNKTID